MRQSLGMELTYVTKTQHLKRVPDIRVEPARCERSVARHRLDLDIQASPHPRALSVTSPDPPARNMLP